MGIFSRVKLGWAVGVRSVRVLAGDPELLAFPVLSGLTLFVLGVLAAFVVGLFVVLGPLLGGYVVGGVLFLVLFVVLLGPAATAVSGIAKTALYLYATTGVEPDAFEDVAFDDVFPERGGRRPGTI